MGFVRPLTCVVDGCRRRLRTVFRDRGTGPMGRGREEGLEERGDLDFDRAADQFLAHGAWPDVHFNEVRDWVETDEFRAYVDIKVAELRVDLSELDFTLHLDRHETRVVGLGGVLSRRSCGGIVLLPAGCRSHWLLLAGGLGAGGCLFGRRGSVRKALWLLHGGRRRIRLLLR